MHLTSTDAGAVSSGVVAKAPLAKTNIKVLSSKRGAGCILTSPSGRGSFLKQTSIDQSSLIAELERMKKILNQIKTQCIGDSKVPDELIVGKLKERISMSE